MIAPAGRPLVIAGFERRLAEIGPVDPVPPLSGARPDDPEEALRELMVVHLPRAAALTDEQLARVCELLDGISDAARTGDVRFIDAFNVWFEAVDGQPTFTHDDRWRRVRARYASLLVQAIARLRQPDTTGATDRLAVDAEPTAADGPGFSSGARAMTALILADHWIAGFRLLRRIDGIEGVTAHCLICNNRAASPLKFAVQQAAAAAATGPKGVVKLLRTVWQRRMHFTTRRLHDDAVVAWIRTTGFWIGLHAMGVIYRNSLLGAFGRGVLNSHIGLLPEYRGRSVMEWSILAGAPTGITVFFMDAGIDTGADIILRRAVDVTGSSDVLGAKTALFQRDADMYRAALRTLVDSPDFVPATNTAGRRYYVMSRVFARVVESLLTSGPTTAVEKDGARTRAAYYARPVRLA